VHLVDKVPLIFFIEAERRRTAPFWKHPVLQPLGEHTTITTLDPHEDPDLLLSNLFEDLAFGESVSRTYEDEDDDLVPSYGPNNQSLATFEANYTQDLQLIRDFAAGLEYQLQFRDSRWLEALQREGASFLRLARTCMLKETRRGETATTWDRELASAMFYRPRPRLSDRDT
jgi:hypothetical protein